MAESKKTTEKKVVEKKSVLLKPRMTEKAVLKQETQKVYTFNVELEATKKSIKDAIKATYKVTPLRVRTLTISSKKKFVRGKWGVKGGGKKAYVYLKKGDKIDVA